MSSTPSQRSICCIGSMTMDRALHLLEPGIPGSSNPVTSRRTPGGVARNVAENLARLGVPCSLISIVGNDEAGRELLQETARQNVDTGLVQKSLSKPTGSRTRAVQPDGRLFVSFSEQEIFASMDRAFIQSRWLQIKDATFVFADGNLPAESLSYLITGCREQGLPLYLDAVSTVAAKRLPLSLHGVDTLILNVHEARALLGEDIARDVEGMGVALCQRGVTNAVVTMGRDGLCAANTEGCTVLPAAAGPVVNVAGAGEALVAGTLYGRFKGFDMLASLGMGLKAAALTIACEPAICAELSVSRITTDIQPQQPET